MRLIVRLFLFASSLFIVLYGILPGLFSLEGNFIASFVAGRSFLNGVNPVIFYRFPLFQRLIEQSGFMSGLVSYAGAAPSSIMADAILALPPAVVGRFLFTALNIAAIFTLVHTTAKISGATIRTAYLIFLSSSFALAVNFQSSEPFILVTLLFVLALYAYSIGRVAACGAILGLAFPFSPLTAIPALLFLLSTRWRVFTYFIVAAVSTLALTYVVVGQSAIVYYFQRILPAYMNGRIMNPFSESYQTAWSFFRRLFVYNQTLNPHPFVGSMTAYLAAVSVFRASVIVPAAYFFYKGLSIGKPRDALVAASFPIVFLSPAAATPDLIILAPAVIVLVQSALEEGQRKTAYSFAVLYAIACLPNLSSVSNYLGFSSLLIDYERFLVLIAFYIVYLVYQKRVVPARLRPMRALLTAALVCAVSVTLYLGDHSLRPSSPLPLRPALDGAALEGIGFSPGLKSGKLICIGSDSGSANFIPHGIDLPRLEGHSVYRYSSDQSGRNFAIETVQNGVSISYFRTRGAESAFPGRQASVSPDGDYGAFVRHGKIFILDLDPRYISPVDSLSLMPYIISSCTFNSGTNNELVFIIDSLNSSYSIGTYNLFSRKVSALPLPFQPGLLCSDGDDYYITQDVADTTRLWKLSDDSGLTTLFAMRGNIYDIAVLHSSLYLSSDFRRGLDYPTVYELTNEAAAAPAP